MPIRPLLFSTSHSIRPAVSRLGDSQTILFFNNLWSRICFKYTSHITCLIQPNSGIQDGNSLRPAVLSWLIKKKKQFPKQAFDFVTVSDSAALKFTSYACYGRWPGGATFHTNCYTKLYSSAQSQDICTSHNCPSRPSWLILDNLHQLMECQSNVSSTCRLAYSILVTGRGGVTWP